MLGQRIVNNILGTKPKFDCKSKNKRPCKVCGEVHKNLPFTDCYSEENDGPLPDSLEDAYRYG